MRWRSVAFLATGRAVRCPKWALSIERFGTQWRSELGARELGRDPYRDLPVPRGILGGDQPPGTGTEVQIAPKGVPLDRSEKDKGWIAQFYVRPNRFFFVNPQELALIGPVGIQLDRPLHVRDADLPCSVYPDPEGRLAMAMVIGNPRSPDNAIYTAYDVVSPILDTLAFEHDQPLPICQRLVVGIPSGIISVSLAKPPKPAMLPNAAALPPEFEVPELREAVSLYRESVSSNNPFHQFLTFWKAYENACAVRGRWRREKKKRDLKVVEERFPPMFAWSKFSGKTFDQAKQELNDSYRVALAHGDVRGGRPRTGAISGDLQAVSAKVPAIRYMARITIGNVRKTFVDE